jgi:formylglycine-generating enzyme required for sulfatase activity
MILTQKNFCIDKYEFTAKKFVKFLNEARKDNNCKESDCFRAQSSTLWVYKKSGKWYVVSGYEDYPMNYVYWAGARDACKFVGKRLCTDPEWVHACRGPNEDKYYPYGGKQRYDQYDPTRCQQGPVPPNLPVKVGSKFRCEGGYPGLFDMAGNVWEHTATCPSPGRCYRLGGAVGYDKNTSAWYVSCFGGWPENILNVGLNLGFRCCKDPTL